MGRRCSLAESDEKPMANDQNYEVFAPDKGAPIKAWTRGVPVEDEAKQQLLNIATLPFIYRWIAVMPDVHLGKGATVGSVIPTKQAIIPAAVGVDIGCGMMAVRTSLHANDLPDNLHAIRTAIEKAVPHGRTDRGGTNDRGAWKNPPKRALAAWAKLEPEYNEIIKTHPRLGRGNDLRHLGTLGTGNHFIEICLDESKNVWIVLHSGSRGVGNRIGQFFIELAKKDMSKLMINLPDADLAYLPEGTDHFNEYVQAVHWAQSYAMTNRELMMEAIIKALADSQLLPPFEANAEVVNCHHNYVAVEEHYGERVFVTRKGAVRAGKNDLGIIPGSMGAKSFIVRGKGNPESFESCSHGAGRAMSRTEAKRRFTVDDHVKATAGIECRKDEDVIDETPAAYKSIDDVMQAQSDLVDVVHTLRQIVVVKG
jgi:tRNA-splicing ligase RtcB